MSAPEFETCDELSLRLARIQRSLRPNRQRVPQLAAEAPPKQIGILFFLLRPIDGGVLAYGLRDWGKATQADKIRTMEWS